MVESIFNLPDCIKASAARYPDKPAFVHNDVAIDYATLTDRCAALARTLQAFGARKGDRIGIFCRKGIDATVGLYGAMAAGGAYVPLDPAMPSERLGTIIDDCGIRILITDNAQLPCLRQTICRGPSPLQVVIGLDDDAAAALADGIKDTPQFCAWKQVDERLGEDFPEVRYGELDLAYIMYTSGSTGVPKGLMHTHGSGLAYARLAVDAFNLNASDRLANHAPLHFDISTLEYFATPLAAATTLILGEDAVRFPATVTEIVERQRATVWYSVPFALCQWLRGGALDKRDLSALRWVLFGGEPFPVNDLMQLMAYLPQACFVNVYGPAEVNHCTHYVIPRDRSIDTVPIGREWRNTQVMIVDDDLNAVADGVAGELLVSSTTLMQGYWGQPEKTKAVFHTRVDPDSGLATKFLRTGDLAIRSADGVLEFLGRRDRQIKLRGHRIELDEIESQLLNHPQIFQAAAMLIKNDGASAPSPRIIAAVIPADSANGISEKHIKQFIGERLPRYAMPDSVHICNEFPRTGSDKIDRLTLAAALTSAAAH